MTVGDVLSLFGDALGLVVIIVMVLVVPSLFVGLFVAVIQAATQVNEQTLSFLPRLIMTLIAIMAAGPWILGQLLDHFHRIFSAIPLLVG
jgi:flagellar biosynthetic protein FliQ